MSRLIVLPRFIENLICMFDFKTRTTQNNPWGESLGRILNAALAVVDPANAIYRNVQRQDNHLEIAETIYKLDEFQHIYLAGAGKAASPMARAMADILGKHLSSGIVITKVGYRETNLLIPPNLKIFEAGHPLPDQRGVQATGQIIELLNKTKSDDLVIFLISGGGSALLTSPVEGIRLADLQELTNQLLNCGATIHEINTLRKHLDRVKGGGLAYYAAPARVVTMILSDVVGDELDVIASGPTVADSSTFQEAWQIIEKYRLQNSLPHTIYEHLQAGLQGKIPETPKAGEAFFQGLENHVIGNNHLAARSAVQQAQYEGFQSLLLTTYLQGEARQAAALLTAILRQITASGEPLCRPACLVVGGETTVTIHGNGLGGRNQELALATVETLAALDEVAIVTLATDGGDGPTNAAGAIVTHQTLNEAQKRGIDPQSYLDNNDSYHFFAQLEDLLKPGATNTNVNDLTFIFAFQRDQ